jgi:hypothetical protein
LYEEALPCSRVFYRSSYRGPNIEVVTGTVTILHHSEGYAVRVHNINLGLKVEYGYGVSYGVKIYDTPDAVELARRLRPGLTTIVPTRINSTHTELRQPPSSYSYDSPSNKRQPPSSYSYDNPSNTTNI